ncbi:MAG: hypothetical protein KDD01_13960, partial [Phaeodactylibacter sp.]|nr:hypothetical protein [Phaeodactylibacter sp.]
MLHRFFYAVCLSLLAISCGSLNKQAPAPPASSELKFTAEPAPEWTQLFYRKSGWFGADGIFSFSLDGTEQPRDDPQREVLLTFSDTFIGEVKDNKPTEGYKMVNNTVAYMKGQAPHPDSIHFFYKQDEDGRPQTFFVPENENARVGQYYWLGD